MEQWSPIDELPPIGASVVVHAVPLDAAPARIAALETLLADDERARAARFRFQRDRETFVVTRGVLRLLLARYTGISPVALRFGYGPNGKPRHDGASGVEFNVSHAAGLALLAFAAGRRVGVDVERKRPIAEANEIAARRFTTHERELLANVSTADRDLWFLRLWTAKEAYGKALGDGLSQPLNEWSGDADGVAVPGWQIRRLPPYEDYVAAVAFEDPDAPVGCVLADMESISRAHGLLDVQS